MTDSPDGIPVYAHSSASASTNSDFGHLANSAAEPRGIPAPAVC